jgi:transposase
MKLVAPTLDAIIAERPVTEERRRHHLCADKGYSGMPMLMECGANWYIPHIRQRKEEITEKKRSPGHKARRWVVERCHSWLNRFRKIHVRYEKLLRSYEGLLQLACAIICFRQTTFIYG